MIFKVRVYDKLKEEEEEEEEVVLMVEEGDEEVNLFQMS